MTTHPPTEQSVGNFILLPHVPAFTIMALSSVPNTTCTLVSPTFYFLAQKEKAIPENAALHVSFRYKNNPHLWDPRVERSCATTTREDTKLLDHAKKSLASFEDKLAMVVVQ